ncbi:type II CAAX endopeptidase family protein [Nonomuraea angiospora]|uniref:CPBP family intramembrane glutamic endopeptidase n=1 Tax=Nonomuraea angiospora TaxID=46172 RepID=UPI003450CAA8
MDIADIAPHAKPHVSRPGWLELIVGLVVALILYLVGGIVGYLVPENGALSAGHLAFIESAVAPAGGFFAAVLVRIRRLGPFGFHRVRPAWILAGAGAGIACFFLSWPVSWLLDPLFPGSEAVQQTYRDATQLNLLSLAVTVFLGGILSPIGEELLFRGLLANFLFRWGPWVGVLVSAAIFAVAHGVNAVMPVAFVVGVATGVLLRASGSMWPAIAVHIVYNSAGLVYHGITS